MMGAKTKKLTIQEGKKEYGKEAAEETKETLQGDNEFSGGDKEFEAARATKDRVQQGACRRERGKGTLTEGNENGHT